MRQLSTLSIRLSEWLYLRWMGVTGACSTQISGSPTFTTAPPHALSSSAQSGKQSGSQSSGTIELQASRSSHACLQDITRHSHRLARLSGPSATPLDRAAAPSAPPERRAEALPERQVEKLAVSTDTLPSPAALFSNQLAGTNGGGPGPGDAHELRQRPGPAVRT